MFLGRVLFNKEYWSFGIKLSIPLMIHSLAKNILDVSDRSMISIYCGKSDVGIYGTIYSISALSLIVWNSINSAFVPYLYDKLECDTKESNREIGKITYIMMIIYAVVCVCLTAVAPEIVRLLATNDYYQAVYIIPPIAAGIFLTCVYNMFANVILYHKKTVGVMIATIVAAIVNMILNAIFIPMYGYIAAAYTTLAAFIVLAISQGVVMKYVHRKKLYNMKLVFLLSLIVVIICIAFNALYSSIIIRYSVTILLLITLFVFRKSIIQILKTVKKDNYIQ